MSKRKVFIVGLDSINLARLNTLPQASECEFLPALTFDEMRNSDSWDIEALIAQAISNIESHDRVDGIASFWDFPGTILVPILTKHFSLPGSSLESVMKCENKYWSRLEQQKVIPESIPQFRAFDVHDDSAYDSLDLLPPFWIKPIKSFRSYLAYQINGQREFQDVMPECREKGAALVEPFRRLMTSYGMPEEIASMKENFIAESTIGGFQCTLEGYAYEDRVNFYGIVDSIREPDSSSFARYEYPSALPLEVVHRLMDTARLAVQQIGLSQCPFNVEFFYDQTSDSIWLLEINPRISESHTDLFYKVNGVSHQSVMVDLALGRKPKPIERAGEFNIAAKFMLRTTEKGRVARVPSQLAMDKLSSRQPGTWVKLLVNPGQRLDELPNQDMYSYEIANAFIGGRDRMDILDKYDLALTALQFDIEKDPEVNIT